MRYVVTRRLARPRAAVFAGAVLFFLLTPSSPSANVAPDCALLVHVQSSTGEWCGPVLDHCEEIVRVIDTGGPVEFTVYFMRGAYAWEGQSLYCRDIVADLTWPEDWELTFFYGAGTLDPAGPVHTLHLSYDDYSFYVPPVPLWITPVACIMMNATGPGRIDFVSRYGNPVEMRGPGGIFTAYATGAGAHAGDDCEYSYLACGENQYCETIFHEPQLALSAQPGHAAEGVVRFHSRSSGTPHLCELEVDTRAEWCQAVIEPIAGSIEGDLHVTADAAGLLPGTYQTGIRLSSGSWQIARCLPVTFTVDEGATAVRSVSWGRVKTLVR